MRLTASRIDLARRCAWPFRADAGPRNQGTSYAAAGHTEHALIEHTLRTGDTTPRSETHRRWLREWYALDANRMLWTVERPIAIDPTSGETRLGPKGWDHRDYAWAPTRFLVATPDAYALTTLADGRRAVRVVDWKTGEATHVKDPRTAGQMQLLGLALVRHFHASCASLEYVLVNDRRLWIEATLVERLDLALFCQELEALLALSHTDVQPVRGPHCKGQFCDYHGRCPATASDLADQVPAIRLSRWVPVLHSSEFESLEHVGAQWALIGAAEKRLAELKQATIMALKERGPAPLPGGGTVAMETFARESIDATTALPVLRELFGDAANEVVETKLSVTKARVEDLAAERHATGESKKAAKSRVLDLLRSSGALRVTEYESPKERPEIGDGAAARPGVGGAP